jgi:hypothetical protein
MVKSSNVNLSSLNNRAVPSHAVYTTRSGHKNPGFMSFLSSLTRGFGMEKLPVGSDVCPQGGMQLTVGNTDIVVCSTSKQRGQQSTKVRHVPATSDNHLTRQQRDQILNRVVAFRSQHGNARRYLKSP